MKQIVCDTGPLLHLREAESLAVLKEAGEIHIPPEVDSEMTTLDAGWQQDRPDWVGVVALEEPFRSRAADWTSARLLDAGEAEALALAGQLRADWLLTDDTAARVLATEQGFEVHGSLGVVLWAAATGHFDQPTAETALEALSRSSLWLSTRILAEAQDALRRLFA